MSSPAPFELEYPEEGAFIARVFAAGGTFKRVKGDRGDIPPPRDLPRNSRCPCDSGKKTKACHAEWMDSVPGVAL